MKSARILFLVAILALGLAGCSQQTDVLGPDASNPNRTSLVGKDGTETLGVPSIAISAGSGFAEGGVGMVGVDSGVIELTVPAGATVEQVLLYWAGGTTAAAGDDRISLNGTMVQGTLIGGPTFFYNHVDDYNFSAYRADITGLGLVSAGANSVTVSDFDFAGTTADENNGASIVVIYDDGTNAEIAMLDGLDMAYFNFGPTLDTTVPQTFPVVAAAFDRVADLLIICGSVQMGRANQIKVTTIAGDQVFDSPMGSTDGMWWDSLQLPVNVPAGATAVTVQVISTPSMEPQGSSLGWVAAGLAVPVTGIETPPAALGDRVWDDTNRNGIQDFGEVGLAGVAVHLLDCAGATLATTVTDWNGLYRFSNLLPGDYMVHFVRPAGYEFTLQNVGSDAMDSDADANGATICTTLIAGETDLTWDAGLYMPAHGGCTLTIGFWKNHAGFGPQADVLSPLLPIYLGDVGGAETLLVDSAAEAVAILKMKAYGGASNGIAKLYAQLLAAKLNVANGADDSDIADAIDDADEFLAMYDHGDWNNLTRTQKNFVNRLMSMFDRYNNGETCPGHCD
jgi:hypothetical protein